MNEERFYKEYPFINSSLLSEVPEGWKKKLIPDMCREIKAALKNAGIPMSDYHVFQTKEKYGSLRWYDVGGCDEIDAIIHKYDKLSSRTCCGCGKPATKISKGWICPWCDECAEEIGGEFAELRK